MLTRGRPGPANLAGYDRVIFLMVLGLAFVWFGLYYFGDHGPKVFFVALGVAFFIFGISQFYVAKKSRDKKA